MNISTATSLDDLEQLNEQLAAGVQQGQQEMRDLRQQQSDVLENLTPLSHTPQRWLWFTAGTVAGAVAVAIASILLG